MVVCPEQATGRVTCNDCRLCDASRPGPVIAFREHGNGSARAAKRAPAIVGDAPPPGFGDNDRILDDEAAADATAG